MSVTNRQRIWDSELEMTDAGLIAASAAGVVDSAAKIWDTGGGFTQGMLVIDVTACEIADSDEVYSISVQGSTKSDFADTLTDLALIVLGDVTTYTGDVENTTGRFLLPFTNMKGAVIYRYVRVYTTIAGTIATGINWTGFITK